MSVLFEYYISRGPYGEWVTSRVVRVSNPDTENYFFLLQNIQISSEDKRASCPMRNMFLYSWGASSRCVGSITKDIVYYTYSRTQLYLRIST